MEWEGSKFASNVMVLLVVALTTAMALLAVVAETATNATEAIDAHMDVKSKRLLFIINGLYVQNYKDGGKIVNEKMKIFSIRR